VSGRCGNSLRVPQVNSKYAARLHAGPVGWFQFGEAWFHLDLEALANADIPTFLAAIHEDAHRTTQNAPFAVLQHFLAFASMAATQAGDRDRETGFAQMLAETICASVYTQEGRATVNLLLACFPNYPRRFQPLYDLFSSIEPYATALKIYERILGPMPTVFRDLQAKANEMRQQNVEAITAIVAQLAMSCDVLARFHDAAAMTAADVAAYGKVYGPDRRLEDLAARLSKGYAPDDLFRLHDAEWDRVAAERAARGGDTEGYEARDEISSDADAAVIRLIARTIGAPDLALAHEPHYGPIAAFSRRWLGSLGRVVRVDEGRRAVWLHSTFGYGFYAGRDGASRAAGPGRTFRMSMPVKWWKSDHLHRVLREGQPFVWGAISMFAERADHLGWQLALSFIACDADDGGAVVVSLWDEGGRLADTPLAFPVDASLDERPRGPRGGSRPWLIHVDAYLADAPSIRAFIREDDAAFLSSAVLNIFDVARHLDIAADAGRVPVLLPNLLPSRYGDGRPAPDTLICAHTEYPEFRWALFPSCLDAIVHILAQRRTLSSLERARRMAAVNSLVQARDREDPEASLRGLLHLLPIAFDVPPEADKVAVNLVATLGRHLALDPERLGPGDVTVPRSPLRGYRGQRLEAVRTFMQDWLPA
jgi:hypothetical protein